MKVREAIAILDAAANERDNFKIEGVGGRFEDGDSVFYSPPSSFLWEFHVSKSSGVWSIWSGLEDNWMPIDDLPDREFNNEST